MWIERVNSITTVMDKYNPTDPSSNWQKWQLYNSDLPAPQSFVDWNFYFLIAAALQRRVWIGAYDHQPLFTNIYVTLVAPPAAGKGISISPTNDALNFWKLPPPFKGLNVKDTDEVSPEEMAKQAEIEAIMMGDQELADMFEKKNKKKIDDVKLIIPMGANATTFESLTQTIAKSVRRINFTRYCPIQKKDVLGVYTHSTLAILLTELSSLFKKQAENTVNLITDLYDCKPYKYETKHMGTDYIQKGCINLLAGTTLSYMEQVFSDRILNEGYASRSFFIVETKPRFFRWNFNQLSDEQKAARKQIIDYVKSLTTIYGEVKFTEEAEEYLRVWWEEKHHLIFVNKDPKLEYYYGRKNNHVKKMCAIIHFSENRFLNKISGSCDMKITLDTVMRVMHILNKIEINMHQALTFSSSNPNARASRRVLKILQDKPNGINWNDLQVELWEHMDVIKDLKQLIEYMEGREQIESFENPIPELRRKGLIYKLKLEDLKEGE